MRGLHAPRFSGNEEDWRPFIKEFKEYCKNLSPTRIITDDEILLLFMQAIPPQDKKELDLLKAEKGGKLDFGQVLQHFDSVYDRNQENATRRKLEELQLPNSGRITLRNFENFQREFQAIAHEIPDMSKKELITCFRKKLPNFFVKWVVAEETVKDEQKPKLEIKLPISQLSLAQAQSNLLHLMNIPIREISYTDLGSFEITLNNVQDAEAYLTLHNKFLGGNPEPIVVRKRENKLGISEMIKCIRKKLEEKQREDDWIGGKGNNRQTRAITKDKGRSSSRSTSPKSPANSEGEISHKKKKMKPDNMKKVRKKHHLPLAHSHALPSR